MTFYATIQCVFKGKKRLETISQTKARLIIELDGGGHYTPEQEEKDEQRTNELNAMNLTVVRICNLDIDRNFCGVCEYVDRLVQNSLPQSASLTAPSSEGALDAATSKQ